MVSRGEGGREGGRQAGAGGHGQGGRGRHGPAPWIFPQVLNLAAGRSAAQCSAAQCSTVHFSAVVSEEFIQWTSKALIIWSDFCSI